MKKARSRSYQRNSRLVHVQLTVTKFRDIIREQGGLTDHEISLPRGQCSRVRLEKDTLFIKPPAVTLVFTLASGREDRENYYPLGISYIRAGETQNEELRLGFINFPQKKQALRRRQIMVTDSYRDKEKHAKYKFSIFVQRGSDGRIGIIDPSIVHDNSGH